MITLPEHRKKHDDRQKGSNIGNRDLDCGRGEAVGGGFYRWLSNKGTLHPKLKNSFIIYFLPRADRKSGEVRKTFLKPHSKTAMQHSPK